MANITPKISVVTATWNCAETIQDCLASVSSQTHQNIEHIVIDGGSSDGTLDVLKRHKETLAVLISEPDNGIYDALNKGIFHSSGEIIGFLHADDLYADTEALALVAHAFQDPSVQAVYGDLLYVRKFDTNKVVRYWQSRQFVRGLLFRGWMPAHPALYVRKRWYERIGGFDTKYRISADYFSILQMFSQPDFQSLYIPRVLVKMRLGGASNRSLTNIMLKSKEDLDALRRSGVGGIPTLMLKNLGKVSQFLRT